jgi:hypothetical protein
LDQTFWCARKYRTVSSRIHAVHREVPVNSSDSIPLLLARFEIEGVLTRYARSLGRLDARGGAL